MARRGTAQPDRTFCHTDDAEFPSNVLDGLCDGVVHAAGLADAWTVTDGLDAGVAGAIGQAHVRFQHKWDGPLIGITDFEALQGREQLC